MPLSRERARCDNPGHMAPVVSAPAFSPRGAAGRALPHLLVAVLWLLAWQLARIQEYAPHASLWFPPTGLAFAVGLTLGWRGLPALVAASIGATLSGLAWDPRAHWTALAGAGAVFGLSHGIAYVGGARLLLRWGVPRPSPRAVSLFLLIAPLSALLATAGGVGALTAFGLVRSSESAFDIVLPWWIGDFVGVVALAPFFAVVLVALLERLGVDAPDALRAHEHAARMAERGGAAWMKLGLALLPLAGSALLIYARPPQAAQAGFLVFFGIIPMMWIAHTEGAVRTYAAAAVISAAIAGVGAALGPGPHALTYQFAALIVCGTSYFGLAVPLLYADNRELRQRLTTDALTGAATRTLFLETCEREVERARRFGTPLSLVLFDVDHFKQVNDTHGHAFGDAVLATLGARCRGELRASDVLGRVGGEEFAVLLPMTGLAAALETAERLAAALRREPVAQNLRQQAVTASFGVSEIDAREEGFAAAYERADAALYAAKRAGRDRVCAGPAQAA